MRKAEDLKYGRFVERICQCNFSITFESSMLQKMYKISRENGPDSEQFNSCIKLIPSKFRVPLKKAIKQWMQQNETVYTPLKNLLIELEVDDKSMNDIWIAFRSHNMSQAKNVFNQFLQYYTKAEQDKYTRQIQEIYIKYAHENQPNFYAKQTEITPITPKRIPNNQDRYSTCEKNKMPISNTITASKPFQFIPGNYNTSNTSTSISNSRSRLSQTINPHKKKIVLNFPNVELQKQQVFQSIELKNQSVCIPKKPELLKKPSAIYTTVFDYFFSKFQEKGLWDIDPVEERKLSAEMKKSPQLFDILIENSLGKGKIYKDVIKQAREDEKFQKLLANSLNYPLHKLFESMRYKSREDNQLHCDEIRIKNWQINEILAQTTKIFQDLILKLILEQKENIERIMIRIADLVFDVLTRKGNLPMKIQEINKIGCEKSHPILGEIRVYDFLVLFTRVVQQQRIPHFGYLLHKNQLPVPFITTTISQGQKRFYTEIPLIQDILLDRKAKIIYSVGTEMTEKNGKTELLSGIFGIQYKHSSDIFCQFHKGCMSLYTNLQNIVGEEPVFLADLHGNLSDFEDHSIFEKVVENSCLVILHIHQKQIERVSDFVKGLIKKDSRLILFVRDCPEEVLQVEYERNFKKIYLPSMKNKNSSSKQIHYNQLTAEIAKQIGQSQKYIDYKSLIEHRERGQLAAQEKIENSVLHQMKSQKKHEIWSNCFPNICQFRDTYRMELKMLELQRLILYDKKDERNIQFLLMKEELQEKQKAEKQRDHFLTNPSAIYFQKYEEINIRSINCKISEWKKTFTERLQKQLVDLRMVLEKKGSKNQKQVKQQISEKEKQLKQFDISIDTLIQEITIVASYNNQYEKYQKCVKNYYKELYKTMNPINLIDGNTLLFGNHFLMSFFQDISKDISKQKKIYVVSVIGIQSSAKSTLMNYLFNCRFETSAGRCTKGAYFTISQTENQAFIVIDTEGLMSVSARDRVFDIQIASFTFLISDIVLINNKGQINAPIRELLGVCTYALKELNQRKPGKERSRIFFAIRDQSSSGVHTQKAMLSDIIRELKTHEDLADFAEFLDFSSEDIYPLQSAYNQETTALDTTIEKPNYCFSESIMAMRSKIIKYLKGKRPTFNNLENFYQQSRQMWEAIRRCGEHIFNFQEVLQIKIKQELKKIQEELLESQFTMIGSIVQQSIKDIQRINNNQQLRAYKASIMGKIQESQIFVKKEIEVSGKKMKGVKADWIKDLVEDSKRQFNDKVIMHIEFIDNLYKQKVKKNKGKNFLETISQITSEIIKSDKNLQSIRSLYEKQCSKLLQEQEYNFDDTQPFLKGVLQKEVYSITNVKLTNSTYLQFSNAKDDLKKFDMFFETSFLQVSKKSFGVDSNEKIQFVKLLKEKFQVLLIELARLNNKFLPITGQNNKNFILEFKSKIDETMEILKSDMLKITKNWKANQVKLNEQKFKLYSFAALCKKTPELIFKNRQIVKQKAEKEKRQLIKKKWEQIQKSFKIKGDSSKVASQMVKQFQKAVLNQLYQEAKKELLNSLVTLISKFSPVKMIQQAMRLTFKSCQSGKTTWIKCFKAIYNINVFLKQEILYQQNQFLELKNNINIQKERTNKTIPKRLETVAQKLQTVKKFDEIGQVLGIDIKVFQYQENVKNFSSLLVQIKQHFKDPTRMKQSIRTEVLKEDGKFVDLEKELNDYVRQNIMPKIIGCQARCPICSMKCKLSNNHDGGHKCVEGSHLQSCFSGIKNHITGQRSQNMCFTEEHIQTVGYFSNENSSQMIPALEHIGNSYPEWLDHFQQGPYQDKINELNCERIWANIGDVLIATKFEGRNIKNNNVKKEYRSNPLQLSDISSWLQKYQKQNDDELEMLNSLLLLLRLASLFG